MKRRRRTERLDQPLAHRVLVPLPSYDPDAFGRVSEAVARFFGTARYLVIQSVFVLVWIIWNVLILTKHLRFDPYPFILLNLMFSTQAAYAAPLILLAQNRQALRDKVQAQQDRSRDDRQTSETEFMAREMASLRIALGEVATRDFVRSELQRLLEELNGVDGEVEGERYPDRRG